MSLDTEEQKVSPKEVIHAFLSSRNNEVLTYHRRPWGTETGWRLTLDILYGIKHVALDFTGGHDAWQAFI